MKKKDLKEKVKTEAAEDLGLADKVRRVGWGNLTSRETGRIGALVKGIKKRGNDGGGGTAP